MHVPGVAKVLEQRTELAQPDIDFLTLLVDNWALVADLAFSDLVLWVPTWNDGGLLAAAQVRASTAPTSLAEDLIGTFSPRGRNVALDQAVAVGRATAPRSRTAPLAPEGIEAYPVRHGNEFIGVIARHASPTSRVLGQLEQVYLESADAIFAMISRGLPWVPLLQDSVDSWDRPRVGDGLIRIDAQGEIDYASPNATSAFRRLGLATGLVGQSLNVLVKKLNESPVGPTKALDRVTRGGYSGIADIHGSEATIMMSSVALNAAADTVCERTIFIVKDVTAVRTQQRALLSKEATIREINHRVKNNLQMVNSLLRIQARRAVHQETTDALNDAQQRISAISAIHDVLSKDVVMNVDVDELVDSIITAAAGDGNSAGASVERRGSGGYLPTGIAIPLAMSVSELVHNALEHSRGDLITIDIQRGERELVCVVHDNGEGKVGEPGLGLSIVGDLVTKELRGEFEYISPDEPGTSASISIPLNRSAQVSG